MILTPAEVVAEYRQGNVVTTQQAAERLGVSDRTVREWVTQGHLTPLGESRPYLLLYSDVADVAAARKNHQNAALKRARAQWKAIQ